MKKRHSTISEAIQVAKCMKAKRTILTHFSQRYPLKEMDSLVSQTIRSHPPSLHLPQAPPPSLLQSNQQPLGVLFDQNQSNDNHADNHGHSTINYVSKDKDQGKKKDTETRGGQIAFASDFIHLSSPHQFQQFIAVSKNVMKLD